MRRLGNLALVGVALGVAFAATEAALTFLVPPPIVWLYPQESYEPDGKRLHRLRPNQSAFTQSAPVSINSHGLRNDDFSPRPEGGVVRILCIGDSLTFGNGVRLAETYPKQLEALLNGQHGRRYEVINAGVPGYDTWQEIAYLRDEGVRLAPDVVIVEFYGNDIVPRPKAVPVRSSTVPEEGTARRIMYWLKRSRLITLLSTRIRSLKNEIRPSSEVTHERALLAGMYNDFNEAGFREVDSSFAELASLAQEYRFERLVVLFPMPNQLLQSLPRSLYPGRVIDIATRHGLPTLDLTPAFAREFRGLGSLFIQWDGHPNPKGYAIAAREIGDYVRTITDPGSSAGARRTERTTSTAADARGGGEALTLERAGTVEAGVNRTSRLGGRGASSTDSSAHRDVPPADLIQEESAEAVSVEFNASMASHARQALGLEVIQARIEDVGMPLAGASMSWS